jgi:soluble lytic murein transglycosylase-like protein
VKYYKLFLIALIIVIIALYTYPRVFVHANPPAGANTVQLTTGTWIVQPKTIPQLIAMYSTLYGVSYTDMYRTLKCESGFNPNALNATDGNGGSRGIAQFQTSTFNKYSKEAGLIDPNVWNAEDSIHTMAYMFSKGQAGQWSCFKEVGTS